MQAGEITVIGVVPQEYAALSGGSITHDLAQRRGLHERALFAVVEKGSQSPVRRFIDDIYINNTANGGAIIHFNVNDLSPQPLNSTVKHAIFLNNHCEDIFYVSTNVVVATNNFPRLSTIPLSINVSLTLESTVAFKSAIDAVLSCNSVIASLTGAILSLISF